MSFLDGYMKERKILAHLLKQIFEFQQKLDDQVKALDAQFEKDTETLRAEAQKRSDRIKQVQKRMEAKMRADIDEIRATEDVSDEEKEAAVKQLIEDYTNMLEPDDDYHKIVMETTKQ